MLTPAATVIRPPWCRTASFEAPVDLAADICEDLQTALDEMSRIYADLTGDEESVTAAAH